MASDLRDLEPGEICLYHVGYLPRDRRNDQALHERAERALALSERNAIQLVQRRLGDFKYEYMAIGGRRER